MLNKPESKESKYKNTGSQTQCHDRFIQDFSKHSKLIHFYIDKRQFRNAPFHLRSVRYQIKIKIKKPIKKCVVMLCDSDHC